MSAKPAGESLENARKPHSIYARTAQYFGECFLYNSNSINVMFYIPAAIIFAVTFAITFMQPPWFQLLFVLVASRHLPRSTPIFKAV